MAKGTAAPLSKQKSAPTSKRPSAPKKPPPAPTTRSNQSSRPSAKRTSDVVSFDEGDPDPSPVPSRAARSARQSKQSSKRRRDPTPPDSDNDTSPPPAKSNKKRKTTHRVEVLVGEEDEPEASPTGRDEDEVDDCGASEDPHLHLKRVSKYWTSYTYAFFKPEVEIIRKTEGKKIRIAHQFACARSGCKYVCRRFQDKSDRSSTSNMTKHTKKCWGEAVLKSAKQSKETVRNLREMLDTRKGIITGCFKKQAERGARVYSGKGHTATERRTAIACWVAHSLRPFDLVEDEGLHEIMKTGRPTIAMPSAKTVQRDVMACEAAGRERVGKMLREMDARVAIALDTWSSPNHLPLMGVIAYFEDKGVPTSLVLDMVEVDQSHTGLYLAEALVGVLNSYGIEDKLLSITADNASNNDAMIRELKTIIGFPGAESQARCFAHIINLVAKSLVRVFDNRSVRKRENETNEEYEARVNAALMDDIRKAVAELSEGVDLSDELSTAEGLNGTLYNDKGEEQHAEGSKTADWVDETDLLDDEAFEELEAEIEPVRLALWKIRKLAVKILHSTTILLPAWKRLLTKLGKPKRTIPRDVTTRWNSTESMLTFALEYKEAINLFTSTAENGLRDLELSAEEWEILFQLATVLTIFRFATQKFSRSTPQLASVIPVLDMIDRILTNTIIKVPCPHPIDGETSKDPIRIHLCISIRAGLALAKKTLNRYYELTDESGLYRICLLLDPRRGLIYFDDNNWPQEWIDQAKRIARKVLERDYPAPHHSSDEDSSDVELVTMSTITSNIFDIPSRKNARRRMRLRTTDELELFLNGEDLAGVDDLTDEDIVAWWSEPSRVQRYPRLSRMARDYLSIPATTVDVERLFSKGRILLPHTRNRLGFQSIRSLFCVGDWCKKGFIEPEDVTHNLRTLPRLKDGDPLAYSDDEKPIEVEEVDDEGEDNIDESAEVESEMDL